LRHALPIFGCGKEIIWIPGYRIARGWEVKVPRQNSLQLTVAQVGRVISPGKNSRQGRPK
jgi:hypothetical protein